MFWWIMARSGLLLQVCAQDAVASPETVARIALLAGQVGSHPQAVCPLLVADPSDVLLGRRALFYAAPGGRVEDGSRGAGLEGTGPIHDLVDR